MIFSTSVQQLIHALKFLPGIGEKTAQRLTLFLLVREKGKAKILADSITNALEAIQYCKKCRILTETEICNICANLKRTQDVLCVVESPLDVISIEQANCYSGLYFILMGHLSPIDGINPEDLHIELLLQQIKDRDIKELILATNSTVEGEATAHYIQQITAKLNLKITRIAHGIPMGGELEYIDVGTISRAMQFRLPME